MRVSFLFVLLNLLFVNALLAQNKELHAFWVNGSINIDTGTVKFDLINDTSYYPKSARNFSASIEHGKFTITGRIPYPQAYDIDVRPYHVSHPFLIDTGTQRITINTDSIRETP